MLAIAAVILLVIIAARRLVSFYIDWLWFGEVGQRGVFWTRIEWQIIVGLIVFVVFALLLGGNLLLARRLAPGFRAHGDGDVLEAQSDTYQRLVVVVGGIAALIVAVLAGITAAGSWQTVILFARRESFAVREPLFGHDVGFFVYSVPLVEGVLGFLLAALIAALILSGLVHLLLGGLSLTQSAASATDTSSRMTGPLGALFGGAQVQMPRFSLHLSETAVAHLSALLAAIFVVVAGGQVVRGWNLVYSTSGVVYGAGATDVNVRLLMTRVTLALALALAAVLIWNVVRRRRWWPATIAVWVVVLIVARGLVPLAYQSLVVNPNQLAKEREYIARNITATKAAYNLNAIESTSLPAKSALTAERLTANAPTIRNIRLWDPDVLTTSYRQLQGLRPYYSFVDSDVDRYQVNGVYRQTMLAARELNIGGLPTQAQTWVNQHITYTHGFGVAMSAVNQVTSDGSPDFLIQDVPPRSVKGLEVKEPRIYFGENGTDYTLVKTDEDEFDYPGKSGDVFRAYEGSGGIRIAPLLTRLAFAVREGTIKFFTTAAINDDSRIIIRNRITDRARTVAPFLRYDNDPYLVVDNGRLWWILDGYTVTRRYPYATPEDGVNYIRNSVKVVVDAYDGDLTFYAADQRDPLLRSYSRAFPELFKPLATMPKGLVAHLRYPEDIFRVQANVYSTYHVDSPDVLYNKGDQWAVPADPANAEAEMPALYVIMRLPGQEREEFLQMLPFVPNGRQNMISWLGARSDGANYGKIVNIRFSESTTVVGPGQVEGFINQDPDIASQRTLWGQQGSEVLMGNLLVVPIEDQLLYVQPLYLQSSQTKLPQLKRVIVFYRAPAAEGSNEARQVVAMQPTLAQALASAFGEDAGAGTAADSGSAETAGSPPTGAAGVSAEARDLISRADRQFTAAEAALRGGDFAEYGRQIEALRTTLARLKSLK